MRARARASVKVINCSRRNTAPVVCQIIEQLDAAKAWFALLVLVPKCSAPIAKPSATPKSKDEFEKSTAVRNDEKAI